MLNQLALMIDEQNYPYFSNEKLEEYLNWYQVETEQELKMLARKLCIIKAGIVELKLGDITIPSPRNYFLSLASSYRGSTSKAVTRADGT